MFKSLTFRWSVLNITYFISADNFHEENLSPLPLACIENINKPSKQWWCYALRTSKT